MNIRKKRKVIKALSNIAFSSPVLRLALPSILSNITVPLLGMVDTAIVGHMDSPIYLAAIAMGSTMLSMMYWIFNFLRMSTTGLVAQAYGAANEVLALAHLRRSLIIALFIGLLLLLFQQLFYALALSIMQVRSEVYPALSTYFFTCVWAAPAVLMSYSLMGWFVGHRNTRIPMLAALLQNILNIVFSLFFVYVIDCGICGVALGTVLGSWCGVGYMFYRLRLSGIGFSDLMYGCWNFSLVSKTSYYTQDIAFFLRTLCLVLVTVYFTRAGSRQSESILAANSVLMQLFVLVSFFMDGFANAAEALCGEFYGAGNRMGMHRILRVLMCWGLCVALFFCILYLIAGPWLLSLLTNQTEVLALAVKYLPWLVYMPLCAFLAFMWDGIFVGLTRGVWMLWGMVVSVVIFFLLWFLLEDNLANHALWLCFDTYLLVRGLFSTFLWWFRA